MDDQSGNSPSIIRLLSNNEKDAIPCKARPYFSKPPYSPPCGCVAEAHTFSATAAHKKTNPRTTGGLSAACSCSIHARESQQVLYITLRRPPTALQITEQRSCRRIRFSFAIRQGQSDAPRSHSHQPQRSPAYPPHRTRRWPPCQDPRTPPPWQP